MRAPTFDGPTSCQAAPRPCGIAAACLFARSTMAGVTS